jgi:hypothetical protein
VLTLTGSGAAEAEGRGEEKNLLAKEENER